MSDNVRMAVLALTILILGITIGINIKNERHWTTYEKGVRSGISLCRVAVGI